MNAPERGAGALMTEPLRSIVDFGMDTISMAGSLDAKLGAVVDEAQHKFDALVAAAPTKVITPDTEKDNDGDKDKEEKENDDDD